MDLKRHRHVQWLHQLNEVERAIRNLLADEVLGGEYRAQYQLALEDAVEDAARAYDRFTALLTLERYARAAESLEGPERETDSAPGEQTNH
jgi:hypothetical protein